MGHTSLLGQRGGCVIVAVPHLFQQLARAMRTDLASQIAANVMSSNEDRCRCPGVVAAAKNTCGCGIEGDTCACLGCAMRLFLRKGNSRGTESEEELCARARRSAMDLVSRSSLLHCSGAPRAQLSAYMILVCGTQHMTSSLPLAVGLCCRLLHGPSPIVIAWSAAMQIGR